MGFIMDITPRAMAAGIGAALLAFAASGAAAADANYVGVTLAKPFAKDWSPQVDFGSGVILTGSEDVKGEFQVGVMAGRQFGRHLRLEAEYQYGQLKFSDPQLGAASSAESDDGDYQTLMANAYAVAPVTERLSVFAGAGAGWGRVSIPRLRPSATCDCFGKASKGDFAYQLRAGAEWTLAADQSLFLQYNWLRLPKAQSSGPPTTNYPRQEVSSVGIGYRKLF